MVINGLQALIGNSQHPVFGHSFPSELPAALTCALLVQLGLSLPLDLLDDSFVILLRKHNHTETTVDQ